MTTTALRAAAIAAARVALDLTMLSTAVVQRRTLVRDNSGGYVETYPTAGTYLCSFMRYPIRPMERESDVRVQAISHWMFHFPVGADIRQTDRLVVGSRTFEVVGAGEGTMPLTHQVITQEIL